jgi:hypothetical protein
MALGAVVIEELVALLGLGLLKPTSRSLRRLLRFRERSSHQRAYAGDQDQAYTGEHNQNSRTKNPNHTLTTTAAIKTPKA